MIAICVGIFICVCPKFINEISSPELYSTTGIFINIGVTLGFVFSYVLGGVVVPYSDEFVKD